MAPGNFDNRPRIGENCYAAIAMFPVRIFSCVCLPPLLESHRHASSDALEALIDRANRPAPDIQNPADLYQFYKSRGYARYYLNRFKECRDDIMVRARLFNAEVRFADGDFGAAMASYDLALKGMADNPYFFKRYACRNPALVVCLIKSARVPEKVGPQAHGRGLWSPAMPIPYFGGLLPLWETAAHASAGHHSAGLAHVDLHVGFPAIAGAGSRYPIVSLMPLQRTKNHCTIIRPSSRSPWRSRTFQQ